MFELPKRLTTSRLWAVSGGYCILPDLLNPDTLREIQIEALDRLSSAVEQDRLGALCSAGNLTYDQDVQMQAKVKRLTATGGDNQYHFYQSEALHQLIGSLVGCEVAPCGSHGFFAYYIRDGDMLGVHRDITDVVLITALLEPKDPEDSCLVIYPARPFDRCHEVNENIHQNKVSIKLRAGESVLLLGSVVPHAVLPVKPDSMRVISSLTYNFKVN
jgi:hypothetical protein